MRDYLIELLRPYAREHNLGKVMSEQEFAFGENAHGPDVSFVGRDKVAFIDGERRVQLFVPDLAIEIASTNDRVGQTMRKLRRYRECGTKEVWFLVAFTREATLYSDDGDRILHENDEFRSALIPGFSIALKDLFDRA